MIEQVHDNLLASEDHWTDPEEHHDQERKTHNVIGTSNWCVEYEARVTSVTTTIIIATNAIEETNCKVRSILSTLTLNIAHYPLADPRYLLYASTKAEAGIPLASASSMKFVTTSFNLARSCSSATSLSATTSTPPSSI